MEMGHSLIPRIHIAEAIDNSIRLRTAQNQNKTLKVISNAMFHHCYLFFVFVQRHADNLALFKMGALVLAAILAASFILQDEFVVFRFRKTRNLWHTIVVIEWTQKQHRFTTFLETTSHFSWNSVLLFLYFQFHKIASRLLLLLQFSVRFPIPESHLLLLDWLLLFVVALIFEQRIILSFDLISFYVQTTKNMCSFWYMATKNPCTIVQQHCKNGERENNNNHLQSNKIYASYLKRSCNA